MLWDHYVFHRGASVEDMWDRMFQEKVTSEREISVLYITGRGFDVRAQAVLSKYTNCLISSGCKVANAKMLLVGFKDYQLTPGLADQTEKNAAALEALFRSLGSVQTLTVGSEAEGEDDISASTALRVATEDVLRHIPGHTDIVLDVSSLPRIAYLSFMLAILESLIPKTPSGRSLHTEINFQILVGEDASLDSHIQSEDPSNDLILIPGYSSALQLESMQEWPLAWFPVLGENRTAQLQKVTSIIPEEAEIYPVLPHPSKNLRRGDELLLEYRTVLFDSRETPLSNVIYAHEAHPFEAYRQLLGAMTRYKQSMQVIGGCRLVVTPLASKLITIGAALACFDMKTQAEGTHNFSVAIPCVKPKRYVASTARLNQSNPEISALYLTGDAYGLPPSSANVLAK